MAIAQDHIRRELAELQAELAERERQVAEKERQLERYAADLRETFKEERRRAQQLQESYVATVRALADAVEARDAYTGKHAERVAAYGLEVAARLDRTLTQDPQTEFGFLLHDVGKVAIPDHILHKPEPLSEEERRIMAQHPVIGWQILESIDFLAEAKEVVRSHHERWDGRGYPDGLRGEQIPLSARVFAVADTLDAITTERPYRKASPLAKARDIISKASGSQFDPDAVEALTRVPDDVLERIRKEIS